MPIENPSIDTVEKQSTDLEATWNVIVYDDPVNLMEYVTKVFQKVFGYDRARSEKLMEEVHRAGKSLVWSGSRERGELHVEQLHGYQLKATLEKAE